MTKQSYFGLDYSLDTINVSNESKDIPRVPSNLDNDSIVSFNVLESKDLLSNNQHLLNIFAVSRAAIPRTPIPIKSTYSPAANDIIPPYSEQLTVIEDSNLLDSSYVLNNNNVLINLNILNSEAVLDEIPTIVSTEQQPFWS